jgi:hypothetical protein
MSDSLQDGSEDNNNSDQSLVVRSQPMTSNSSYSTDNTIDERYVSSPELTSGSDITQKLIQLCGYRRQCWLCLGQEEVDSPLDRHSLRNYWLSPCRCRGTAKWIHNECLQLWIDEKQKLDTSVAVKCSQCNTQYVLVFPPNGRLVDLIVWYENTINNGMYYTIVSQSVPLIAYFSDRLVSTYAMVLCVAGALYMSAFTYGAITCHQIIGK